jgi:hypothetical protein
MRAKFLVFLVAGGLALSGATGALAQDATPEAENLFASLGLPELILTVTEAGVQVDQAEIPAGRYLATLNNESSDPDVATSFVRLDEGETLEDLSFADEVAAGTPAPSSQEEVPIENFLFLFDNYIVGGPTASSPRVVVDLPAGDYGVGSDDPATTLAPTALTVTGDPEERVTGPEPEAGATIVETGEGGVEYTFTVEGELKAGPQIVKVLNASDQPHIIVAFQYPEAVTKDQVMATFMFDPTSGATPAPDMLDFEQVSFAGFVATQSAGATQWVTMNLAAGQVILVCFVPDPVAEGLPHFMEGMILMADVAA